MDAMLASIRPMKESTISSAEMSISTPCDRCFTICAGKIVLQRERQPVVHVHLNGDEQKLAHLENRYPLHVYLAAALTGAASWRTTLCPLRRKASSNASASVALVVTSDRSTPR